MKNTFIGTHLDFIGFVTSLGCAVHCAFLPFLISALPLLGLGFWVIHGLKMVLSLSVCFWHYMPCPMVIYGITEKKLPILIVSLGFAIIAFGLLWGPEELEFIITPLGASLVGIAHYLNWRFIKKSRVEYPDCTIHNS